MWAVGKLFFLFAEKSFYASSHPTSFFALQSVYIILAGVVAFHVKDGIFPVALSAGFNHAGTR